MNKSGASDIKLTFEFYSHVRRLCRQLELWRDMVARDNKVTGSQAYLLWAIDDNCNCTLSQLADVTGFALNTISTLVKELAAEKYVCVRKNEADARSSILSLTDAGRVVLAKLVSSWETHFLESFSELLRSSGAMEVMKELT